MKDRDEGASPCAVEYALYAIAAFAVGWFSLRVFVGSRWSDREKAIFSGVLTVSLFVGFGVYRLSTGKDPANKIQELIFCSIYPFTHCPNMEQAPLLSLKLKYAQLGAVLKNFHSELQKNTG